MKYRELTDKMNIRCYKKVQWPAFAKLASVFQWEFVATCIDFIPDNICKTSSPVDKVRYLYGICKSKATVADYKKKETKPLFDLNGIG